MKKLLLVALALLGGLAGVQKINAATLYAVLSSDKTTVTFYYDDNCSARGGSAMWESYIYPGNENKITTVTFTTSVKNAKPTSGYHFFYNLYNLTTINNLSYLKTSEMVNMEGMFYNCAKLTSLDISYFNTEKVKYMKEMFAECRALEKLMLPNSFGSTWTTTSMRSLFYNCQALKEIKGVTYFNTTSVTDMSCMFYNCKNLDMTKLVEDLDTRYATDLSYMFYGCKKLTTLKINDQGYIWDKDSWQNVSNMFANCSNLKTIYCKEDWSKLSITNGWAMFDGCTSLVGGKGTKAYDAGVGLSAAHPDNSLVPGYFTGEETYSNYLYKVAVGDVVHFRYDKESNLLGGINPSYNFTSDVSSAIKTIKINPSVADANVTSMDSWFSGLPNMTNIEGLQYIKTASVTSMKYLFYNDAKLESIDLRSFDLAGADCSSMFSGCTSLKTIYCDEDYSTQLIGSTNMFLGCTSLRGLKGTTFSADHIDASYARPDFGESEPGYFTGSEVYTVFNSSTGVLTYYYDMQRESRSGIVEPYEASEEQLRFETYSDKIRKVVFDPSMANKSLPSVRALLWSGDEDKLLSNLTEIEGWENLYFQGTDMSYMFAGCTAFKSIDLFQGGHFSTENVTYFYHLFTYCTSLETVNMSQFNTSNAIVLANMFTECNSLQSIDVSMFDMTNVQYTNLMFYGCENLRTIYCDKDWSKSEIDGTQMFEGCVKLVGKYRTKYSEEHIDIEYARPDNGVVAPGYFTRDKSAIDNVSAEKTPATKILHNGTLLIQRNDKRYSVLGQVVEE